MLQLKPFLHAGGYDVGCRADPATRLLPPLTHHQVQLQDSDSPDLRLGLSCPGCHGSVGVLPLTGLGMWVRGLQSATLKLSGVRDLQPRRVTCFQPLVLKKHNSGLTRNDFRVYFAGTGRHVWLCVGV